MTGLAGGSFGTRLDSPGVPFLPSPSRLVLGRGSARAKTCFKVQTLSFEQVVDSFYQSLYHFALSLAKQPSDACDLTQETFYLWATKGHQLRDTSKTKSWLFTTLYHQHLNSRGRQAHFPHCEIETAEQELPNISPPMIRQMDVATVMDTLRQIDELHRLPLSLFYLEEHSYAEIAAILDIPVGTVMSRLARGKALLRQMLNDKSPVVENKIVRLEPRLSLERKNHE